MNNQISDNLVYAYDTYYQAAKRSRSAQRWLNALTIISIIIIALIIAIPVIVIVSGRPASASSIYKTSSIVSSQPDPTGYIIIVIGSVLVISLINIFICIFLRPIFIYIEAKSTEGMLKCKNAIKRQRMLERKANANKDASEYEDEYEAPEQSDDEYPEQ